MNSLASLASAVSVTLHGLALVDLLQLLKHKLTRGTSL